MAKKKKRPADVQFCLHKSDRELLVRAIKNDPCISYEVLAEQFGISATRVGQIAKAEGGKLRSVHKLTPEHVKEIRKRFHIKKEGIMLIALDYPWVTPHSIRSAAWGHTYASLPMPKMRDKRTSVREPERPIKELINIAILYATGLFTIEDLAGYFDVPLGGLQNRFFHLNKKGWNIPLYGKLRRGIPDFDHVDVDELIAFAKKNRHKMRLSRKYRESPRGTNPRKKKGKKK